ncbi:MAG: AraC family ligand binding domain-containing protein, partial [Verrucomicrobia bacterium]|nr:AraC family ligand binding domain-containing protein [Verrucomicrobiota bacterium]
MRQVHPIAISFPIHPEDTRPWMIPQFIGLNTIEIRSPYMYRPHQHHEYEVIIIDHGRYECRLNDDLLRLTSGNLLIVKPGDWHQDTCLPSLRYFGFCFKLQQIKKD